MTTPRPIRAVLFDLGGTLMYSRHPWDPILEQGYRALAKSLRENGLGIETGNLRDVIRLHLDRYFARREQDLVETTYLVVLRDLLAENGHSNVDPARIRRALDAFYLHTQANWVLEEDALLMLRTLEAGDYRLGLISNAGDNQDVFQLVRKFEIEPFFDFILTSAACSYRKPHPRIFELALAHWDLPPQEIVMVGDSLESDIHGAQQVGITGIWITRRAAKSQVRGGGQPGRTAARRTSGVTRAPLVKPDAIIQNLHELPILLSRFASRT